MPDFTPVEGGDFYFVDAADAEEGVRKLLAIVQDRIPKRFGLDPIRDIQLLCPMNRGGLGARSLNIELMDSSRPIVLKNSLVRLQSALFESRRPDRQLFITLLGGSTNQSFAVYPPPDFFNSVDPLRTFICVDSNGGHMPDTCRSQYPSGRSAKRRR